VKGVAPILSHKHGKREHIIAYASYKGLFLSSKNITPWKENLCLHLGNYAF